MAGHRSHRRARGPGRLVIAGVVAVVALAALGAGAYFALHSRWFAASTVSVAFTAPRGSTSPQAHHHESVRQVVAASGLSTAPPLISVDTSAVARRIESQFPWVLAATVTEHWPHTVAITVTDRVAVATVAGHGGASVLVDAYGRRLGPPGAGQSLPALQFAVKRGSVQGVDLATTLPTAAQPGLQVASTLPPAFRWQVALITVDSRGWVTLHLATPVTFELGPASNLGAKYEAIAAVIEHTTLHAGDVVDVSVPQASTVSGP